MGSTVEISVHEKEGCAQQQEGSNVPVEEENDEETRLILSLASDLLDQSEVGLGSC